jgi:hypothetical protein
MYRVVQTIRGREGNEVDLTFFQGSDKVQALAALVSAAASEDNDPWFTILGVRFDILPDPDPWADEPPF